MKAGIAIGMADPIPGVSGGTIAYITGLYDQIIDRLSRWRSHPEGWVKNLLFLLPVVVGLLLGLFLFAHVVDWFLVNYPELTLQGFVGLVVGSLFVMLHQGKLSLKGRSGLISMTVAAILAVVFALMPRPEVGDPIRDPSLAQGIFIFAAGAAAAATMLLPGVSGSMLQLIIGSYSTYIAAVKDVNVLVLAIFLAGAILGIVAMARTIGFLFRKHYYLTQALIGGLVIGSIVVLWPWDLGIAGQLKGVVVAAVCALVPWWIHRLQTKLRPSQM